MENDYIQYLRKSYFRVKSYDRDNKGKIWPMYKDNNKN